MMTITRVFTAEILRKRKTRSTTQRYFFIAPERDLVARFGKVKTFECKKHEGWAKVFAQSTVESMWISSATEETEALLRAVATYWLTLHGRRRTLGDLLLFQSPNVASLPALRTIFRHVVGEVNTFKMLPLDELAEVLLAPKQEGRDLFIGGSVDPMSETITLTRGNLEPIVVPTALFRPSGKAEPDFTKFSVGDYGNTVRFGEYEATADAILYELDADFRKRLNARRREEEKGFGASLRRLRIQKHLARSDFPNLSPKTIARIERGETGKPHGNTLSILAKTLGVAPDEIETY